MMLKVCFILPSLHAGGTENYALRFIRSGLPDAHFTVLSICEQRGDLHEKFAEEGVSLKYQAVGYCNPVKFLRLLLFLYINKFDVVCAFNGNFGGVPLSLGRLCGIRKRIAFYRRSTPAFRSTFFRSFYNRVVGKLVLLNATTILSNSQHALDVFFPCRPQDDKRFRVIPNGVDARFFQGTGCRKEFRSKYNLPEHAYIVGHVGRFDPAKNHCTAFKVAHEMVKRYPDTIFIFCGKDTDGNAFMRLLREYRVENHCVGLGLVDNVAEVLKCFDVFFFPSLTEGQPNALIEAMLSGLPVVSSAIPPIFECTPECYHKWLVEPLDVEGFVTILSRLRSENCLATDFLLQEYAEEKFDLARNLETFKRILEQ